MTRFLAICSLVAVTLAAAVSAEAQTPAQRGRLLITVIDQTNAILPNAVVKLIGQEAATQAVDVAPVAASGSGIAVFEGLPPGRYTVTAEFPGFQMGMVRDVRVRAGDTRRTMTLQLEKQQEELTVGRDAQSNSLDSRGAAFSTVLTREQIEALPDDPDEMEAVLKAMSPPGSTIRIDGFTGGKLPPKSQIRSIRLPRMDSFAAQNHGGMMDMHFIDIMTQPGAGPLRGSVDFNFLDDALNARNTLTPAKGDEQLRQFGSSLSGTIKPNKTAFSMSFGGVSQYFSSNLLAVLPGGVTRAEALRQPVDRMNFSGRLDHAINKDHSLRVSFDRNGNTMRNQGVGNYNLPERGYRSESTTNMLRLSENGPIGRRFFSESRLQVRWADTQSRSSVEAPTLRVNDAFTSGGAQVRGGRNDVSFEMASDLDYVRGNHSWRTGFLMEGGRYKSDDIANYLGTYTFASLADYDAGRPSNYTRRIGDPNLSYSHAQGAVYLQDDWRIARSLLLSGGVRYGVQSHVGDAWNLSPRVSAAWSPLKNGVLTFRGSYGYFYDWVAGDVYKQTLLVDGLRQRDLNIQNPSFPDPGIDSTTAPTNQYLWSDDLVMPSAHRLTAGVDRALTPNMRVNLTYSLGWGTDLLRPRNLNAPIDGVRPDRAFANIIQLVTDAESKNQTLNIGLNFNKLNWRRTFLFVNYTLARAETNTSGPFALLANGDNLDTEWGPSGGDIRHRFQGSISMQPITNLSVSLNGGVRSGSPYNITTGRDDNRDGLFNDRPVGLIRNAGRGDAQVDLGGRLSYAIGFGTRPNASGGPVGTQVVVMGGPGGGGGMAPGFGGGANTKRYRIEFYASAQNLLNHANYNGYSGAMTSPLFGRPIIAATARRAQVGIRFGF